MYVIGTAGHVDHGKSTLVRALTGIDPDRLVEEKQRGMTIELGFAWLKLPGGSEVSIVDVPGHERFIKNMLMGVGGIDVALLIIAADEGVMPQTREHLAVLDLLGVDRGIVVMTKRDLADDDWLALAVAEASGVLKGTSLEGSPVVSVSAVTGLGLGDLTSAIEKSIAHLPPKRDVGRPRLPVDRSFAVAGFGTIVTGTLIDGRLEPGDEIEILPSGLKARVRGVQSHMKPVDVALPGTRVAVNLTGVDHQEIKRGDIVASPGWLNPARTFDAHIRVVASSPRAIRHNHAVSIHLLTMESAATVRLLGPGELGPDMSGPVQVRLDSPIPIIRGDRFIIRDNEATLGGGIALEISPLRHAKSDAAVLARLSGLAGKAPEDTLLAALQESEPTTVAVLARLTNISEVAAQALIGHMGVGGQLVRLGDGPAALLYTAGGWYDLSSTACEMVSAYHRAFPLRAGMPKEELRSRLSLNSAAFGTVVRALNERAVLRIGDASVSLVAFAPRLSAEQEAEAGAYLKMLAGNPFSPPTGSPIDAEILGVLIAEGKVVKVSEDVVFLKSAFDEMVAKTVAHLRQHGQITIQDTRDMFGTSRKYSLAFLEHLDRLQVTRRVGESRVLR